MSDQRDVRVVWRVFPMLSNYGARERDQASDFMPPPGWFVDEVIPAVDLNRRAVLFVLRPLPSEAP